MSVLDEIVKAYDIRGTVPDQLNGEIAHALGVAFATFCKADRVLVARDMRRSGEELVDDFARGVMEQGLDVVDLGLASTDMLYYAAGALDAPGAMFTASHNPAQYNGLKLCLSGARPVGIESGLDDVKRVADSVLDGAGPAPAANAGTRTRQGRHRRSTSSMCCRSSTSASIRPLRIVADTANGMGGLVVPAVFERLPMIELEVMYGELDGTFPNHPADPLQPANQRDLRARVVSGSFDLGLAFDGDADRVFVVDETGNGLSGSTTTALLAAAILRTNPGATILHNLICSRAVPETIREHGGVPIRTKVGHSFIKQVMAETGAVFGGEHSAHYYFARNYRADSGLIASMVLIDELSTDWPEPVGAAQAVRALRRQRRDQHPRRRPGGRDRARQRCLRRRLTRTVSTGSRSTWGRWWFNLRPSNTEPLLRLNLEAADRDECDAHVAEVLALITGS